MKHLKSNWLQYYELNENILINFKSLSKKQDQN